MTLCDLALLSTYVYKKIQPKSVINFSNLVSLGVLLSAGATALANHYIREKFNEKANETLQKIKDELDPTSKIQLDSLSSEKVEQFFYSYRIVLSIALTKFSHQFLFLNIIHMLSLGYAAMKLTPSHWVKCVKVFDSNSGYVKEINGLFSDESSETIEEISAEHFIPLIPKEASKKDEGCPICDDDAKNVPQVYFCSNHAYHVDCLVKHFFSKSDNLLRDLIIDRKVELRGSESTVTYPSSIPRDELPSCPECRGKPIVDHHLYLWVKEEGYRFPRGSGIVELREENA